jgi:hypothetical protein
VVILDCREIQFGQDAAHVLLDSAFRNPEAVGDAAVGAAFGHQSEHLSLSRR